MITKGYQNKIIKYVADGFTSVDIAEKEGVSKRTIERHIELIKTVYEAKNLYNLVAIFFRQKRIK